MTQSRLYRLILTGPLAGRNIILNDHEFVRGVLEITDVPEKVEGIVTYMGRAYRAYLEGSDELREAQAADEARKQAGVEAKEPSDGQRDLSGDGKAPGNPTDGNVQPNGSGATQETADVSDGSAPAATGSEGDVSDRDGHKDPGLSESASTESERTIEDSADVALAAALRSLDPDNDEHWNTNGKPAMAAIAKAYGSEGVTRKDAEAALPDWDRDKAREAKELAEIAA